MTIRFYASYGVLAHEKHPVFTLTKPANEDIHDIMEGTLPDGWTLTENVYGEPLLEATDGTTYLGRDILTNYGDDPVLRWYDGTKSYTAKIKDVRTVRG